MKQLIGVPAVAGPLESFIGSGPGGRHADFLRLADAVWRNGTLTELALPAVPELIAQLTRADADRAGYLAVLLGLLAEADTTGTVFAAVHAGLDDYLALLERQARYGTREVPPLTLALLYLLSHFPGDEDRILAAADDLALPAEDASRLARCLRRLDAGDALLGRVWPSPAEWALTEAERESDRQWTRALKPAQLAAAWDSDTRMVLGYTGAKAYWAQCHSSPVVVTDSNGHARQAGVPEAPADVFAPHAGLFRCPACRGGLDIGCDHARCAACGVRYAVRQGILDLTAAAPAEPDDRDDVLKNAATLDSIGHYYETVLRPGFLRLMGRNWGGEITPTDEDAYLASRVHPAGGPVLDLAAGAGRWTAVLRERFGAGQVIALDLSDSMLAWLRGRLPDVAAVQASALSLPFDDASIGAVNCWNALQTIPDPAAVIAEVGRCLAPGGTFTLLTFRRASDPVFSYFQSTFRGPGTPNGMPLFHPAELREWIERAGLAIREYASPGTFIIITAERMP